jgi:hypothetical protein
MPKIDSRNSDDGVASAGPVGRILRVAIGVLVLGSIAGFYRNGSAEFMLRSAAVGVVLVVVYILLRRLVGNHSAVVGSWLGAILALVPLVLVYALGADGGPIFGAGEGQLGGLTFLGVSLVLAGLRADSGCEVMALPNALSRKRSHLACLVFSPIDRLERRWRGSSLSGNPDG